MLVAHRPADPWLSEGASATAASSPARLGIPSVPVVAERIMLERDLALVELTGARLLVDQITCAGALESLKRGRGAGVQGRGQRLDQPPVVQRDRHRRLAHLRQARPAAARRGRPSGPDRRGRASGLIDVIVSAHAPAPAEDKRLPFDQAAPGAVGLETLLPPLLTLHHEDGLPLLDLLRTVTSARPSCMGLTPGVLSPRARRPIWCSRPLRPDRHRRRKLISKSKNSPFDGRRLQGKVHRDLRRRPTRLRGALTRRGRIIGNCGFLTREVMIHTLWL
jgi:dihydroorotase